MTRRLALALILLASSATSGEASSDKLAQPAAYQPTVGSEIVRGKLAATRCVDQFDWLSYAACIDRQATREEKPTDAFKLGLNWSATKGLDLRRRTGLEPQWQTYNPTLFSETRTTILLAWRVLQAKIGLSPNEVESAR